MNTAPEGTSSTQSRWSRAQLIAFRAACALVVLPIHLTAVVSEYLFVDGLKRAADVVLQPIAVSPLETLVQDYA